MGLGLGWSNANSDMAGELRQRIIDQLAQQQAMQSMALQARSADRADRQQSIAEQEHAANMQDRREAMFQRGAGERDTAAGKAFPALGIGTAIDPQDFARTYAGTATAPNFTPERTLPATQTEGGMPLPGGGSGDIGAGVEPNQAGVQATTDAPRQITGRMVSMGTDQQRGDEEKKQLRGRLIANPNLTDRERLMISMEDAGLKVPAGMEPKPAGDNAAADDRRFEQIVTSQNLKRPVTPEDLAWAQAYKTRKTLGPMASSGFADARLDKSENFSEAQVGRKELTDKVEKPYQDATAQAATLRDIVTSAKAGNKFAAAQQPLEATLATVRQAGLNRINAQELGVSASAGGLWDRIQGALGKQAAGQPLDQELQQNLLDYADVLEKAAHRRYLQGHKAVTTRYNLKDEQPMAGPASGGTASATSGGGAAPADGGGEWTDIGGGIKIRKKS